MYNNAHYLQLPVCHMRRRALVLNPVDQTAQTVTHHDPQIITRLQIHRRVLADADTVRRARHDDRAGLERRALGQIRDDLSNSEDHVISAPILHNLAIQHRLEANDRRVRDAPRRRHQTGAQGRKAVEPLAEAPLRAVELVLARRHVVRARVAEHVAQGVGDAHVARGPPDDDGQLGLVVGLPVRGLVRDAQRGVGAAEARRRLEEQRRVLGQRQVHLLRVVAVVEPDAADRADFGPGERRQEARHCQDACAGPG